MKSKDWSKGTDWVLDNHFERGVEESYEVNEFRKGIKCMGLYDTEEYLNFLEKLIKDLDEHEGAEGWSEGIRERIDKVLQ